MSIFDPEQLSRRVCTGLGSSALIGLQRWQKETITFFSECESERKHSRRSLLTPCILIIIIDSNIFDEQWQQPIGKGLLSLACDGDLLPGCLLERKRQEIAKAHQKIAKIT